MANVDRIVSSAPAGSVSTSQRIRGLVSGLIEQHFVSTLGSEQDIVNVVMGLIQQESSGNVNTPPGPLISDISSSRARDYMNSPGVQSLNLTSTPVQRRNIQDGKRAHGLMQLMGWNIVRKGSAKAQKCEFEELGRSSLTEQFLVNAGDSIVDKLSGEQNLERNILGGLLLLEGKWNRCRLVGGQWNAGGDSFPTRLMCAIGAYHGAAKPGTALAEASKAYVVSVVGGSSYRAANGEGSGKTSQIKTAVAASSGPTTNGTGQKGEVVGC